MKLSLPLTTLTLVATSLYSSYTFSTERLLTGEYKAVHGSVKTKEISNPAAGETPEQIGRYSVWLVNANWGNLSKKEKSKTKYIVRLQGTLRGQVNPQDFSAKHTMVDDGRKYIIRSDGDQLMPISGDPFCSTGQPMQVQETVNLVSGTGIYSNLITGTITLKGTVNNCPQQEGFGNNDFHVIADQSTIFFE
ncbi:hypothetical protein [Alteromonas ponticola]|uniref:Uncharacterized protein n=1 Tax=Alteromonas ponticola TaxID=2720613 RepID=A0ABX1R4J9_9ALTE|nr:hypothetical protein [Alteromonas ponticola]NMH61370.1 hypothetical protein [Alteromonas ponticola]